MLHSEIAKPLLPKMAFGVLVASPVVIPPSLRGFTTITASVEIGLTHLMLITKPLISGQPLKRVLQRRWRALGRILSWSTS